METQKLIEKLELCLRFTEPNSTETKTEKIIRESIAKLKDSQDMTSGWDGYGWKNKEYIDNIQEYFDNYKE